MTPLRCVNCGKTLQPHHMSDLCVGCLVQSGISADRGTASGLSGYSDRLEAVDSEDTTVTDPNTDGLTAANATSIDLDPDIEHVDLGFLTPSTALDSLGTLGPYEMLEPIGVGVFGLVLKARDLEKGRVVAVKILSPQFANDPAARRRFLREAQTAAQVQHEHVVKIHSVCDDGKLPGLVMEYIHGQTLQDKLDENGPLDVPSLLRIGAQAAEGLAAAHEQGLVHRDVKPANILLETPDDWVKLSDFGLARAADAIQSSNAIVGTPRYMAPEQALGRSIDHRADLFSLGGVLFAMATGQPAFGVDESMSVLRRVCEEPAPDVRSINGQVPAGLAQVVDRLLKKQPKNRIQSAELVANLLKRQQALLAERKPR